MVKVRTMLSGLIETAIVMDFILTCAQIISISVLSLRINIEIGILCSEARTVVTQRHSDGI